MPNKLPLYFTYADVIPGRRFAAGVRMVARVIAEHDGEKYWLNGVNPGAVTESGLDINSAALNLRNALRTILFGFGAEATDFEDFRAQVIRFFDETDPLTVAEWNATREAVRSGQVDQPGMARVTDDPAQVHVDEIQNRAPKPEEYAEQLQFAA
ncbi:MAG: hypothetical protein AB1730_06225 [Myxococcota bacterium]|jgi:hypothetical protein